jgi:hypothetical protein
MATQKDIDDSNKTIDKLDKDAEEQLKKLEGGKFNTEDEAKFEVMGNWKEYTLTKATLKIEGGFTRVQVGPSDTVVYGFKGEYINPVSIGYILGIEKKTVIGLAQTRIDGAKTDDIGGAKVDLLLGIKYERKGEEDKKVAAVGFRNELIANDKMDSLKVKLGARVSKFVDAFYKVKENSTEIGKLETDIAKVEKAIKDCQEAGTNYQAKVDAYKDNCASKADLKASDVLYDCNGFQTRGSGSLLNMFPDSQVIFKAGSSKVICGSSYVTVAGPKVWFGKSF